MSDFDFDLLVIGAGSGGVRAARVAAELGARVAVVEAGRLGGTCVNVGCVPKKLLVFASEYTRALHDARGFGYSIMPCRFDWATLIEAKDREIARLNDVYLRLLQSAGVELIRGRARLLEGNAVSIDGREVRARHVLIATGGLPQRLDSSGCEYAITSDDVFQLRELPKRIVIIGAGYIALEFAGVFHGLGSRVEVVHRSAQILAGFDVDVRNHLAGELHKQGIELRRSTTLRKIERDGGALRATFSDGAASECDQVLMATGRRPNTRDLGLTELGVALAENGAVIVDAYGRTSVKNVFAVGDCTGRNPLTPVAIADGRALAHTLFGAAPVAIDHSLIPTAVFSHPAVATVGLAEHDAVAQGFEIELYRSVFRPLKHTLTGNDETTLMKLVVDAKSRRVLGCHMVGADAAEVMQGFAVALRCGATKAEFDATLGIHPTAAEEFVTMRRA